MPTLPHVVRHSVKNILFPTDFSPASSVVLPVALALARTYGSTLLPAHAISPEPHRQLITDRLSAPDNRLREDAHKLSNFTRSLSATSFKGLLEQGDLEAVIPTIIHEHDADLVVLGTQDRRGVSKLMLGSDAERIYRSASCPVLTVGSGVHSSVDWKLNRILCPVDVAEDPEPVLHYAPWQRRARRNSSACKPFHLFRGNTVPSCKSARAAPSNH
jgi:nucleotide-binding universal stress UspA family protein